MTEVKDRNRVHQGENIKFARERIKRITQEDLAFKLGMSSTNISRIEAKAEVEDEILTKIAPELGVTVDFLKEYTHEKMLSTFNNNAETMNFAEGAAGHVGHDVTNNYYNKEMVDDFKKTVESLYEKIITKLEKEVEFLKDLREKNLVTIQELKEKGNKLETQIELLEGKK